MYVNCHSRPQGRFVTDSPFVHQMKKFVTDHFFERKTSWVSSGSGKLISVFSLCQNEVDEIFCFLSQVIIRQKKNERKCSKQRSWRQECSAVLVTYQRTNLNKFIFVDSISCGIIGLIRYRTIRKTELISWGLWLTYDIDHKVLY